MEKNSASRPPWRILEMSMLPVLLRAPRSKAGSDNKRIVVSSCVSTTMARA